MKNYYHILDLQPGATDAQIKKQYKLLIHTWDVENFSSPEDQVLAEEKTRLINEAFDALSDPIRREAYDQTFKTYGDQESLTDPLVKANEDATLATDTQPESRVAGNNRKNLAMLTLMGAILIVAIAIFLFTQTTNNTTGELPPAMPDISSMATFVPTTNPAAQQTPTINQSSTELTATIVPAVDFAASEPATCIPAAILPTASAETEALYPSVSDADWSMGPKNAGIVIYEYSDFQCPFCAKAATSLKALLAAYPRDVRVVFRYFPLSSIHPNAILASQAAEAAGVQNKFWQMHDLLFSKQTEWSMLSTADFKIWLINAAKSLNLNSNQFTTDLDSEMIVQKIAAAEADAKAAGLNSTPTLLFNKIRYWGHTDLESLTSITEYFRLPQKSYLSCPEITIDVEKTYTATIKTEKGDVIIELFPKQAPLAVNSFVFLARQNWFDGAAFFRVIPGFVAQAGDPSNSSLGGPGYEFTNEVTPELRFDKPGVLGMTNPGDNKNGSQFFITYAAIPDLDGKYTVFGQVIEGMDVLSSLRPRNPSTDQILVTPDAILSITIEEK